MPAAPNREIHIFPDSAAIAQRASEIFVDAANSAVAADGVFRVLNGEEEARRMKAGT